jgi:ribosome maturation factor RimP
MPNTKAIESKVEEIIASALAAMQYELVRVQLTPGGRYLTLQVMAERTDRKPMTVEDCVKISHAISPKLDEADPLAGRYTLEISSPGVERPLVQLKDFERFTGHVARIELEQPLSGQRRFMGSIVRVTGKAPDAEIEIKTEEGDVRVPANAIARAKLVIMDTPRKGGTKH